MEESKLFKNIWRFNAVIIAIIGILGVVVLLFAIFMITKEINEDKLRHEIVNVNPETNVKETFRLGSIQHVNGSDSVIIPLFSDQNFSLRYSGNKSTISTRNILFSNIAKEQNFWLLPTSKYLIADHKLLNESNRWSSDEDVISILYKIIKTDTNKDNSLTENDKITVAISTPEGEKYTEVISDIDDILGYEVINKSVLAILFNKNGQGYSKYINLNDFSEIKEIELPKTLQ